MKAVRGLWLTCLAAVSAGRAQLPYETVSIDPARPALQALDQITAQTGVRFGRPPALERAAANAKVAVRGPLPAALRALTAQSGILFTRLGIYDYLAVPPPHLAPRVPPSVTVGQLTVKVLGAQPMVVQGEAPGPKRAGSQGGGTGPLSSVKGDAGRFLRVSVAVEADSDLMLAGFCDIDLDTVRLTPDGGAPLAVRRADTLLPDGPRRRMGYLAELAFDMPGTAVSATLSGELTAFQEVTPEGFEFDARHESQSDVDGVRMVYSPGERLGELWEPTLDVRRPPSLNDDEPWLDVALRTVSGKLWRPRELAIEPLPPDDEDHLLQRCRLSFALPAGETGQRLFVTLARRRQPWARAAFTVAKVALPEARTVAGGGPLHN
jgi:hypothetical protein